MTQAARAWHVWRSPAPRRRWLAPEVVQTSAMDCGPAALACVLEGFGIPASYGRLREACQTDVDGTSIDTIDLVARQLGIDAEQAMLPLDHVFLRHGGALPAIVVVRQADGATHFVVVWRRVGDWLQVMDPATGRRWLPLRRFADEVFHHRLSVPESDWRAWVGSEDFAPPLRERLARLGVPESIVEALIARAAADRGWFTFGALDASVRLVASVVRAGGVAAGAGAGRLLQALFERCLGQGDDIFGLIPAHYWSVTPDPASVESEGLRLLLSGAVLVRLKARDSAPVAGLDVPQAGVEADAQPAAQPLTRELAAAVAARPAHPLRTVWALLRQDGLLAPVALAGAMGIAAGALVVEALLFRGVFDIAWQLNLGAQRLMAVAALLVFAALLLCLEVPIVLESLRFGRHLEARLRMALLAKLPQLSDRYFQSRSVSDMADRSHSLQLVRQVPGLALAFLQSLAELALTLLGVALIAPRSVPVAIALAVLAVVWPLLWQPLLNDRDLRLRNHASALHGFYLDALIGLVPVRTHGAERAVRRQHEALLVEWVRASRGRIVMGLSASGIQALLCTALAGWLLAAHFLRVSNGMAADAGAGASSVGGGDLLLVYWVLKLPAIGQNLAALAQQYPAQRNVLLRLLEPLAAPSDGVAASGNEHGAVPRTNGVSVHIRDGSVLAAGHTILRDVQLRIAPGEHVAIVGASGAGKSTLLGLLLGWHTLAGGQLQVDGSAFDAQRAALRRATAWVDPGVQLWNRSLADNLAYACDDDGLARIGGVMAAAQLRGVLQNLPEGLQTRLGEGGALLSGGEGQRVRFGRALMQTGVRLALLDEPFRGLDRAQRAALLDQARRWWHDATLLCVTHDVGETLAFDRVLVIDDGRIVEDGVPAVLAAQSSCYAALLAAEREVRTGLWQGSAWRCVQVANGRVQPQALRPTAAPASATASAPASAQAAESLPHRVEEAA